LKIILNRTSFLLQLKKSFPCVLHPSAWSSLAFLSCNFVNWRFFSTWYNQSWSVLLCCMKIIFFLIGQLWLLCFCCFLQIWLYKIIYSFIFRTLSDIIVEIFPNSNGIISLMEIITKSKIWNCELLNLWIKLFNQSRISFFLPIEPTCFSSVSYLLFNLSLSI